MAAEYIACEPMTAAPAMTTMISEAIAIPKPERLLRLMPTVPTMPKMMARTTRRNAKLLIIGRNESANATIAKTRAVIAATDLGCFSAGVLGVEVLGVGELGADGFTRLVGVEVFAGWVDEGLLDIGSSFLLTYG